MFKNISAQELIKALEKKTNKDCFLDVRSIIEQDEFIIDGFTHFITTDKLAQNMKELMQYDNIYIMCQKKCAIGCRAISACNVIAEKGYKGNIYNVEYGILGYMEEVNK